MPRAIRVVSLLALVSATLRIVCEYTGPSWLIAVTTPGTMACILLVAYLSIHEAGASRYGFLVVLAILISAIGDILLMPPVDKFLEGVAAFLIAHLVYTAAFLGGIGWRGSVQKALLFVLYGALMGLLLWPGLGDMRIPIVVYIAIIMFMGWRAWERSAQLATPGTTVAALGAMLFILSDTILALNRFRAPFASSGALVLSTYFTAQWLLALSIRRQVSD